MRWDVLMLKMAEATTAEMVVLETEATVATMAREALTLDSVVFLT